MKKRSFPFHRIKKILLFPSLRTLLLPPRKYMHLCTNVCAACVALLLLIAAVRVLGGDGCWCITVRETRWHAAGARAIIVRPCGAAKHTCIKSRLSFPPLRAYILVHTYFYNLTPSFPVVELPVFVACARALLRDTSGASRCWCRSTGTTHVAPATQ